MASRSHRKGQSRAPSQAGIAAKSLTSPCAPRLPSPPGIISYRGQSRPNPQGDAAVPPTHLLGSLSYFGQRSSIGKFGGMLKGEGALSPLTAGWVGGGCSSILRGYNEVPQTGGLKTTGICSLVAPEARNPRSRCRQVQAPSEGPRKVPLAPPRRGRPRLASVVTRRSGLCLCRPVACMSAPVHVSFL